ncbi:hypothetical protein Sjap_021119 [Stephania japonica]|uniref:Pentatricopeptide repeat-containing protein n=1 Tax=Stephania japonica TaxID=461633 RepID=A0AAP0F4Q0_9MAGN
MEETRKAFDILFEKNLISYNTIVDGYAKNSNSEGAFELFHQIEDTGIGASSFTFASLLSGVGSISAIGKGEQVHARLIKSGFESDQCIGNALISMYSRCGNIDAASQVFNEMEMRNVISWTSMITDLDGRTSSSTRLSREAAVAVVAEAAVSAAAAARLRGKPGTSSSITVTVKKKGGSLRSHFPLRRTAREAATLWPAAGGPLRRVEATEGAGGRGRGGEHKLPHDRQWGKTIPPPLSYRVDRSRSIDPGPVDQGQPTLTDRLTGGQTGLDSTRGPSRPAAP